MSEGPLFAPRIAWSPLQEAIFEDVVHGTGHTVVLARAGAGKTTTIVEAFHRLPRGERVLMVAFNKANARDLAAKAPKHKGIRVQTLHSFGFSVLQRAFHGKVHQEPQKTSKVLLGALRYQEAQKTSDPAPLAARIRAAEIRTRDERRELVRAASLAKATMASTRNDVVRLVLRHGLEVPAANLQHFTHSVLGLLHASKAEPRLVDYDDMIWLPLALDLPIPTFDRVFVDETQDLNLGQIELVVRACAPGGRVCAVGDDRQAIYAFRGADEHAVENVIERLKAKILPLSVTRRCPRAVVALAQEIVPDLEAAPDAHEGEVAEVTLDFLRREAVPGDFVLSRSNAPLIGLCLGFVGAGLPALIAGRDTGAGLIVRIRRTEARTVPEILDRIDEWADAEIERLEAQDPPGDATTVIDTVACVHALAKDLATVDEVVRRIEELFASAEEDDEEGLPVSKLVLSTTHKAKGAERERVWVLADTYRKRDTTEEENLWYVAITRAKQTLYIVKGT